MKFIMDAKMDNAAFRAYPEGELARMLREIAEKIEKGRVYGSVMDINGNIVGSWDITEEE